MAGCAREAARDDAARTAETAGVIRLLDVASVIDDQWRHFAIRGKTEYRVTRVDGRLAIAARGRDTASGLMRRVDIDPHACRTLRWRWRVETAQRSADLHARKKEDVAASLFVLFGDPGFAADPDRVPTLRYVWTGGPAAAGAIIDSPYLPGVVRSIVVRNASDTLGRWSVERRDLYKDFHAAFGRTPKSHIHAIALFTDNDQTHEPVMAYYASAEVECGVSSDVRR